MPTEEMTGRIYSAWLPSVLRSKLEDERNENRTVSEIIRDAVAGYYGTQAHSMLRRAQLEGQRKTWVIQRDAAVAAIAALDRQLDALEPAVI